jgi:hypothetical protein
MKEAAMGRVVPAVAQAFSRIDRDVGGPVGWCLHGAEDV